MGDRIAVMRDGALQQVDTPERVYQQPANRFVAGFIGSPAMNMVDARCTHEWTVDVRSSSAATSWRSIERVAQAADDGAPIVLGIRPEDFEDAGSRCRLSADRHSVRPARDARLGGAPALPGLPVRADVGGAGACTDRGAGRRTLVLAVDPSICTSSIRRPAPLFEQPRRLPHRRLDRQLERARCRAGLAPPDDLVRVESEPDDGDQGERDERRDHDGHRPQRAQATAATQPSAADRAVTRVVGALRRRTGRGRGRSRGRTPARRDRSAPTSASVVFIANAKRTIPATIG